MKAISFISNNDCLNSSFESNKIVLIFNSVYNITMSQITSYEIKEASVVTKVTGLDKAITPKIHGNGDFDCICRECTKDKEYLVWELET